MRVGFPTGTCGHRSSEEAHSLLGWRVCAWSWENVASTKTLCYLWSCLLTFHLLYSNTCHLTCNNLNFYFIYGIVCLSVAFAYSRFVDPLIWSWDMDPLFLRWFCHNSSRLSQLTILQFPLRAPLLAVLKPNRIICKCTDANCSSFHLRVFLGLTNPQGQRQTSTISIPCDNFGERNVIFNLETSTTTQMQLYKCIHIP
jgi:hypothetical protein